MSVNDIIANDQFGQSNRNKTAFANVEMTFLHFIIYNLQKKTTLSTFRRTC